MTLQKFMELSSYVQDRRRIENIQLSQVEDENKYNSEKRELAKGINSWAETFASTELFNKLIKIRPHGFRIYEARWAEVRDVNPNEWGKWSTVQLDREGKLFYRSGYKWLGYRSKLEITEDNSQQLRIDYLKALSDHVSTGNVYDYIRREFKLD